MFDTPATSQSRPHALHIMERARALRMEMQALRQQSFHPPPGVETVVS